MLRGDPGSQYQPRCPNQVRAATSTPIPTPRAGATSSCMLGLASEQTQLRAGCGARSWKTNQFLCFSPLARTWARLDRTPLSVEQGLGARQGVAGRQESDQTEH